MIIALMMTASCGRLLTSLSTRSSRSRRSILSIEPPGRPMSMPIVSSEPSTMTKSKLFHVTTPAVKNLHGAKSSATILRTISAMKTSSTNTSRPSRKPRIFQYVAWQSETVSGRSITQLQCGCG